MDLASFGWRFKSFGRFLLGGPELLFFLPQNQFNTFTHNICSRFVVLFAVRLKSFVRFCINTGFYFNAFGIVRFWATSAWTQIITHFLCHDNYYNSCGSESQEVFQKNSPASSVDKTGAIGYNNHERATATSGQPWTFST